MSFKKVVHIGELRIPKTVYYDALLEGHETSQCGVNFVGNRIEFVSYDSVVIVAESYDDGRSSVSKNMYGITCKGTFSRTTATQMGWFLAEYFPSLTYSDMKKIAEDGSEVVAERVKF